MFIKLNVHEGGAALRLARHARKLSQRQLGELSGLPIWLIFQIEHGRPAAPREMTKLLRALSID